MTKDPRNDLREPITQKKPLQQPLYQGRKPAAFETAFTTVGTLLTNHEVLDLIDTRLPRQSQRSRKIFPQHRFSSTNISFTWLIHRTNTLCHHTGLPWPPRSPIFPSHLDVKVGNEFNERLGRFVRWNS